MARIVCHQGLQSRLESQLVEPRALRLKLTSTRPHFSQPREFAIESCCFDSNIKEVEEKCCYDEEVSKKTDSLLDKHTSSSPDSGGWSFLQALATCSQSSKEIVEKENTYVHPLVKRSLSTLSEKSLELCTENLGNETGSDILEDSIFVLSSSDSEGGNSPTRKHYKSRQPLGAKKATSRNFPPPLTTISGSDSLQVRPHREDGRLVIKAVKAPSANTLFQAERSNGRLRLCLLKDSTSSFDYKEAIADNECEGSSEDNKEEEFENDSNCEAEEEEEEEEEEEAEEEEYSGYMEEGMDGKRADVGAELGLKKFQSPGRGRCKEGEHENKGLLNWEPFWVATS
ncbi:PREDICTED: protein FANTASTIC FOUR 3 [Theobroma cacao]|uniref:Protein FANTASTIC FOUR 3 n=1 Tax=Theobroma cacao TaxID=3641 RepID=A0AB32W465_THECC|nr:PREDICTED: protein FANTASTIC FOUR 3 [Theobroma cacao]